MVLTVDTGKVNLGDSDDDERAIYLQCGLSELYDDTIGDIDITLYIKELCDVMLSLSFSWHH